LHFFPEPEQLLLRMGLPHATCKKRNGDLCYCADLEPSSVVDVKPPSLALAGSAR
jgi:hypothetical protein